jgi:peptide methionine sulfoxide reductase MsrA
MMMLSTTTTTTTRVGAAWPTRAGHGMMQRRGQHQHEQQQERKHAAVVAASSSSDRAPASATDWPTPRGRAAAAAAALATLAATLSIAATPSPAFAAETTTAPPTTVYFGNGCFWGRQKDFVETELKTLSRPPERVSAVAGYAGGRSGTAADSNNKVCYHFNPPGQVYERLGHAEVVAVELDEQQQRDEMKAFARTYFSQFRRLRDGRLQRLDPQDAGPGYRNVVGLPGGVRSPLFQVLRDEAPAGIELREGKGRQAEGAGEGAAAEPNDEGDVVGVVWVVDAEQLPFYRAEQYHQYHRGMEGSFPASYLKGQREVALKAGRIEPTGCLEFPF